MASVKVHCPVVSLLKFTGMARTLKAMTDFAAVTATACFCFSRSVELHEKVIGTFIEKYMFY